MKKFITKISQKVKEKLPSHKLREEINDLKFQLTNITYNEAHYELELLKYATMWKIHENIVVDENIYTWFRDELYRISEKYGIDFNNVYDFKNIYDVYKEIENTLDSLNNQRYYKSNDNFFDIDENYDIENDPLGMSIEEFELFTELPL